MCAHPCVRACVCAFVVRFYFIIFIFIYIFIFNNTLCKLFGRTMLYMGIEYHI